MVAFPTPLSSATASTVIRRKPTLRRSWFAAAIIDPRLASLRGRPRTGGVALVLTIFPCTFYIRYDTYRLVKWSREGGASKLRKGGSWRRHGSSPAHRADLEHCTSRKPWPQAMP